jgi:hypothetical protein
MRTQRAVLKPQSGFSRPLSGSTETDGKSAELVPVAVVVLVRVVALACALAVEETDSTRAEDSTCVCVAAPLPGCQAAVALERPRIRDSLLPSPETRRQVAIRRSTKVLGEPLPD